MRISKLGKTYGFRTGNKVNLGRKHKKKYPPNTYFRDFLNRMNKEERKKWLREFGKKQSLRIRNDPVYLERLRRRMIGNKYQENYLQKNPIWVKPDWGSCVPHISVPIFVPIIYQKVPIMESTRYYTMGIVPEGLHIFKT